MNNEFLPVQVYESDERIFGRPFGVGRPFGFGRPWGGGFGRPWGFGLNPFLGGFVGGLLGSALLPPFYGYGFPGYGFGYPYYW